MIDPKRLDWILDTLVRRGTLHSGQRQGVRNRGHDQCRHILLDKGARCSASWVARGWPAGSQKLLQGHVLAVARAKAGRPEAAEAPEAHTTRFPRFGPPALRSH